MTQERMSFSVDGVTSFVDEMPTELQQLFNHVIFLRNEKDRAELMRVAMQRAVDHAETQLVTKVREHRTKVMSSNTESMDVVNGEVNPVQ